MATENSSNNNNNNVLFVSSLCFSGWMSVLYASEGENGQAMLLSYQNFLAFNLMNILLLGTSHLDHKHTLVQWVQCTPVTHDHVEVASLFLSLFWKGSWNSCYVTYCKTKPKITTLKIYCKYVFSTVSKILLLLICFFNGLTFPT